MATAAPPIHSGRPSALGLVGVISPSPSSPTSAVPILSPASPATGPNSPSHGHGVVAARTETFAFHMKFEDVLVPMRDGVRLSGDLYLPAIDGEVEEGRQFPCVLIRTPYNKSAENPDLRSPGIFWTQNGYACFLQDVRGRFKSAGEFYKYTGEAPDGYDTVEWLAEQAWCNGNICTDGPSYLCHVQTSMCLLKPPHLTACFMNKGGFWNAWTSGVRQGGAFEARQWVWGVKNATRKNPIIKEALESVDRNFGAWLERFPFKRGDSPLAASPEYENFIFDQQTDIEYGEYWKQIGLNVEEYIDEFVDIPCMWMSGWYDIYARSTIDFFTNLVTRKRGPHILIMGPWQHVGAEGHVAGDVDFGVNALISGNLAPNVPALARRWFDRWVTPAAPSKLVAASHAPSPLVTPSAIRSPNLMERNLAAATAAAASTSPPAQLAASSSPSFSPFHRKLNSVDGLSSLSPLTTSGSIRLPDRLAHSNSVEQLSLGPSLYILPSSVPRERPQDDGPLPPAVRYFRMGGGDGHRTSQGCMFHGGVWMAATVWPPVGTESINLFLGKRTLTRGVYDAVVGGGSSKKGDMNATGTTNNEQDEPPSPLDKQQQQPAYVFTPHVPPVEISTCSSHVSVYDFDPRHPCPSIGGNVFGHRDVLIAGAFNQVERPGMFLCKPPYLPLSSRGDVVVFRTPVLTEKLDVTGMPIVRLVISSNCVDTDFTAKLIDEYPPSQDYPAGYAMQITHGIRRCRFRNSREKAELLTPGVAYEIEIELYPTSNLFVAGHRIRLDISSSNFPHFDINLGNADPEMHKFNVQTNSIYHHEAYPSRLILPIQTRSLAGSSIMHEVAH